MINRCVLFLNLVVFLSVYIYPARLQLEHTDAEVWSPKQYISGHIEGFFAKTGTIVVNDSEFPFYFEKNHNNFRNAIKLNYGTNQIFIKVKYDNGFIYSDTIYYKLMYQIKPLITPFVKVTNRKLILSAEITDSAGFSPLKFKWVADFKNPSKIDILFPENLTASVKFPDSAKPGDYFFNLYTLSPYGDTINARTYVTFKSSKIVPFDICNNRSGLLDSAIVYGLAPYNFTKNGNFREVTRKIPELKRLGITILWLQPVYPSRVGGQGYDLIDYFTIRPDYGTEEELHKLISTAHEYNMAVLFDFVPNHSSIYHPYAQDAIKNGSKSHYFYFYQREKDNSAYGSHYNVLTKGNMSFVYYFWQDLVNFDYNNPEVQRMMIEAGKKWIREFNIDGYRIDAAWGVNARNPDFFTKWRKELKSIKPELLLIGEDKATQSKNFRCKYDAAYDWTADTNWISQWVWQVELPSKTIFNSIPDNMIVNNLIESLTNNGHGYSPAAIILRFMENNDTERFLPFHGIDKTKMVAALLFSLPGIPLIYNGQEIGIETHPYNSNSIFFPNQTIESQSRFGLFQYYQSMCLMRKQYPAFATGDYSRLPLKNSTTCFAFSRSTINNHMIIICNLGKNLNTPSLVLRSTQMNLNAKKKYCLKELFKDWKADVSFTTSDTIPLTIPGTTTRIFSITPE